jgi:hypothetical protein
MSTPLIPGLDFPCINDDGELVVKRISGEPEWDWVSVVDATDLTDIVAQFNLLLETLRSIGVIA